MADRCERTAKAATDPAAQYVYRELARQWRQKAEEAEALERRLAAKREDP
jgi:hypothetical protein